MPDHNSEAMQTGPLPGQPGFCVLKFGVSEMARKRELIMLTTGASAIATTPEQAQGLAEMDAFLAANIDKSLEWAVEFASMWAALDPTRIQATERQLKAIVEFVRQDPGCVAFDNLNPLRDRLMDCRDAISDVVSVLFELSDLLTPEQIDQPVQPPPSLPAESSANGDTKQRIAEQ